MKQKTIYTIYFWFLLYSPFIFSQPRQLTQPLNEALSNYTKYSNEIVHALSIMHDEFEFLNKEFNEVIEQNKGSVLYVYEPVLTNYDYFPVLPQKLYQELFQGNVYIPSDQRGKPLELVGKINNVSAEIDQLRNRLANYIQSGQYKTDANLAKGYEWLRRVEVLYHDIYTLQDKLHWSLSVIYSSYERPVHNVQYYRLLMLLQNIVAQSKRMLKAVRAQDHSTAISVDIRQFENLLTDIKLNKFTYLQGIPEDEPNLYKRYDNMVETGYKLLNNVGDYLNKGIKKHQGKFHPDYYYYYNLDILDNYNRYGDGLATLFNKISQQSGELWPLECEYPMLFEVVYPQHPAFDSLRRDSMPDPEWFIKQLEIMRADSLRKADSLRMLVVVDTPNIGDPTLEGFATNNLILLLDISASMNEPEKLPLLKYALEKLLELMRPEDNITIITYSDKAEIILKPTSAQYKEKILEVLNQLKVKTSSDADLGLKMAFLMAKESYIKGGNNRIVMATDGNFKIKRSTKRRIKVNARHKKILSVFYFSKKEYPHTKQSLQMIAKWGKGRYTYINQENAEKALLIEAQSVRKSTSDSEN